MLWLIFKELICLSVCLSISVIPYYKELYKTTRSYLCEKLIICLL